MKHHFEVGQNQLTNLSQQEQPNKMPTFRNLLVEVTDSNNIPLREYGVRKSDRAREISCYIQSDNDKPFRILFRTLREIFADPPGLGMTGVLRRPMTGICLLR